MTRAILEGRKTMTRRVIKPQPQIDNDKMWHWRDCQWMDGGLGFPKSGVDDYSGYKAGDILWVREAWKSVDINTDGKSIKIQYAADKSIKECIFSDSDRYRRFGDLTRGVRPSISMPREAARIFLKVTDVRVERLRDISGFDCEAEGIGEPYGCRSDSDYEFKMRTAYKDLWNTLDAKRGYSWESNPWVWVISFRRTEND
jgi:hypothetical protein